MFLFRDNLNNIYNISITEVLIFILNKNLTGTGMKRFAKSQTEERSLVEKRDGSSNIQIST